MTEIEPEPAAAGLAGAVPGRTPSRAARSPAPACCGSRATLLYLDRHWREERQVCDDLLRRLERVGAISSTARRSTRPARPRPPTRLVPRRLGGAARRGGRGRPAVDHGAHRRARHRQDRLGRPAARSRRRAARGPGPGSRRGSRWPRRPARRPRGSQESVAREAGAPRRPRDRARSTGSTATTVHRLLGWRPDSGTRFRHHRENPLPYDVVVVDEVSMVSLSQMARLLEARASTSPAGAGRRPRPALLGRGGRRARRPGRRFRRASADPRSLRLTTTHRTQAADGGGRSRRSSPRRSAPATRTPRLAADASGSSRGPAGRPGRRRRDGRRCARTIADAAYAVNAARPTRRRA